MANEHKHIHAVLVFLVQEGQKWLARTTMLAIVGLMVYLLTPLKERAEDIWSTPSRLEQIENKLDVLATRLRTVSGETRIIQEEPGLSYVAEPVHQGDDITLYLGMRRTDYGKDWTLLSRTAMFTDETNIPIAGDPVVPGAPLDTAISVSRLNLEVPRQIRPGRVTVFLSLKFSKSGTYAFETTSPIAFTLLPEKPE